MKEEQGWRVAGRAVLFVVFSAVALGIAARYCGRGPNGALTAGISAAMATLLLTAVFTRLEGIALSQVGAGFVRGSLGRCAIAFAAGLTLPFVRAGLSVLTGPLRYERAVGGSIQELFLMLATFLALAAREELAFRGFALRVLDRRFGSGIALLVVALLFALEHVLSGATWWSALFGAGMGSMLFGVAALRTRGLAVPIGLHAAWNFGDWMLGGKPSGGLWRPVIDSSAEGRVEVTEWVSYLLVMLPAAAAIWLWPRHAMGAADGEA